METGEGDKIQEPRSKQPHGITLRRVVGIPAGVSFIVGSIIGSGIFATPKYVLLRTGSVGLSFIVWFLGAIISICGGLCYAELGTTIPKAGSVYSYLLEAFGALPAFLFLWTEVLFLRPSEISSLMVVGAYVIEAVFPGCTASEDFLPLQKLIAALTLGVITFVNCSGAQWSARVIISFTVVKMVAIVLLIGTGIIRLAQGYNSSFEHAMKGSTSDIGLIGLAFYSAMYAYAGWDNLNPAVEEMKNPKRDLPLCIFLGVTVVAICYILVNVGYLSVLSPAQLLATDALAVHVANSLFGVMAWVMPVLIACSIFGAVLTSAFGSSRVVNRAARRGHFPQIMAMVNTKTRTPVPALVFNAVMACLMLLPKSSNFESLFRYNIFLGWTVHTSAITCLLVFRFRRRHISRPYKVWFVVPVLMLAVGLCMVITPIYNEPLGSFYWILLIMAGIPVYLVLIRYKILPKGFYRCLDHITYKLQTVFDLTVPSEDELSRITEDTGDTNRENDEAIGMLSTTES